MIPVPELRDWVGTDATQDATLAILEAAAVARVELWTRGYFGLQGTFTDRVIGDGTTRLALPKYPIVAVASVNQTWLTDAVPAPVAVTEYVVRSPYLIRTSGLTWARGAEFTVEYTAGFAADAYPEIYRSAVRDIVAATFSARSVAAELPGADVFKSETSPDYSYERFDVSDVGPTSDSAAEESVVAILARLPRRVRI